MGYLVIDAEGHYGDYATVYAAAPTLTDLPRKYLSRRAMSIRIVSDGGYPKEPGSVIHSQFAGHYRTAP